MADLNKTTPSRLRIVKNLLVLSTTFLLICTSGDGLQTLQSTLNRDQGIGVVSIAVQFACGCITALFLIKYFIVKFGSKNTIAFCLLAHIPSTAANFYPHWESMVPAYIILGISSTLLWGSNSAYLNGISNLYSAQHQVRSKRSNLRMNADQNFSQADEKGEIDKCCSLMGAVGEQSSKITLTSCHSAELNRYRRAEFNEDTGDGTKNQIQIMNVDVSELSDTLDVSMANEIAKSRNLKSDYFVANNSISEEIGTSRKIESNDSNLELKKMCSTNGVTRNAETLFSESKRFYIPRVRFYSLDQKVTNEVEPNMSEEKEHDIKNSRTLKHMYPNSLSPPYSKVESFSSIVESTTARFFGFHSMLFQSGHIWSNMISYFVLQAGVTDNNFIRDSSCMCGVNFCNVESKCFESNLKEPNKELKYILISIFLALNVLSVLLVAFFLDPLDKKESSTHYTLDCALATLKQLKKPKQLLLVPLSMYMGMSQGFVHADFTKAFVGCSWGMHHVGLVTLFYGITCSIMSTLSAWMVKHLGRRTIFVAAAVVNLSVNILTLLWEPDSEHPLLFFVVAGMWGFLMGSFWSQLKAFHGVLFKSNEEAAFGCYELSHSIGACVSFAYSNQLCIYVKIYVLLFVSTIGMVGYLIVD